MLDVCFELDDDLHFKVGWGGGFVLGVPDGTVILEVEDDRGFAVRRLANPQHKEPYRLNPSYSQPSCSILGKGTSRIPSTRINTIHNAP